MPVQSLTGCNSGSFLNFHYFTRQTIKWSFFSSHQTVRFKNELERNITIKLGYANAKVSLLKIS